MSAPSIPIIQPQTWASLSSITFYWAPPSTIGGSVITNYTLLCSSIPYSTVVGPSTYNVQISSLTNNVDYVFQIAASNSTGTSPYARFNLAQAGAPAVGASSVTVSTVDVSTVNVNWSYSTNANEAKAQFFGISILPSTGTTSTLIAVAYANERNKYITNLSTNNYTFLVQAISNAGWAFPNAYSYSPMTSVGNTGPQALVYLYATTYSGSGTWNDSSTNGKNATLEVGTAAKNAAGNGIVLNGSTSWTFPNVSAGNAWTFSVWYKNTGALTGGSGKTLLTQKWPGSGALNLSLGDGQGLNTGTSYGGFYDGSSWRIGTQFTFTNNLWTNAQVTWDGTTVTTYVNGALTGTTS